MRALALLAGLLTLIVVWTVPLQRIVQGPFSAFMVIHMGVVAVAAPLLALAAAGSRWDPVSRSPRLFDPMRAAALELVVVWAWHAPALHEAARSAEAVLVLEQASFLGAGLLVWLSALGGGGWAARRSRAGGGVVALLLTSMHMTLLGALLALPPRALYVHAAGSAAVSPLADQHLGGAIMLVVGGISYLVGGLALTRGLLVGRGVRADISAAPPAAEATGAVAAREERA